MNLARMSPNVAYQDWMDRISESIRTGIPWWIALIVLAPLFVVPDIIAGPLATLWMRFPGLDKPTHFLAFILVFLITYGVVCSRTRPLTERGKLGAALALSLMISLADEAQQALFGHGRTAEYGDLVADAAGALVGLVSVSAPGLGHGRAAVIIVLLLLPVAVVTAQTYDERKHFNRGMAYERQHEYQRARTEYMLALKSGFQTADLYNTIAWLDIEFLSAEPADAKYYAAQALQMDPDNPDVLDTYGWILVVEGRTREGLVLLERAYEMKPQMYCIDLHLGAAYMKMGDSARAVEHLTRQVERRPDDRFGQSARQFLAELERTEK